MTEREAFEAWMRDTHGPGVSLVRSDDGYISTVPHRAVRMAYASVQMLWEAWQARAQPAQAVPLLSDAHIDQITRDQWGAHAQYLHAAYRAYARAIEAAVRAKLGVVQWLPIETAPKDWGVTKFDVWANDARFADCWWGKATYEQGEPGVVYQSDYDCNGPVDSYVRNATHWQPLPPPPIVGKEGA